MANYSDASLSSAQAAAVAAGVEKVPENETSFLVLEDVTTPEAGLVSIQDLASDSSGDELIACCPLADAVNKLRKILRTVLIKGIRPGRSALLMQDVQGALAEIDQGYELLKHSVKVQMSTMQLQTIEESSERARLVSDVKNLAESLNIVESVELENFDPEVLDGISPSEDGAELQELLLRYPDLATAVERLAAYCQPISVHFGQLQQMINHASQHRVSERRKIAEIFKECGLTGLSKQLKEQAVLMEMGCCKQP